MLSKFPNFLAATEEGVPSREQLASLEPVPPLSQTTLKLAAELEIKRQQETLMQAVGLAVAATLFKVGAQKSITLTQADFARVTKDGRSVQLRDLKNGELVSVCIAEKQEVAHG